MVIVGGTGTVIGPFIGSAIILVLRNYVSAYLVNWMTVMGVVFIATVLWAPDGVLGLMRRLRAQMKMSPARSESPMPVAEEGKDTP